MKKVYKRKLNKEAIRRQSLNQRFGEVEMFEYMLGWFKGIGNCSVVELHKIPVQNIDNVAPKDASSESSDLLTICYSSKYKCAKVQLLQAKYCKTALKDDGFVFNVDSRQYRLLKDRPLIDPKQSELPCDILKNACSPAISAYGVFYIDWDQKLDMAYEITDMIQPKDPQSMNYGKGNKNCALGCLDDVQECLRSCHCCQLQKRCCSQNCEICKEKDLLSTMQLETYMLNLIGFHVGSPIRGCRLSLLANGLEKLRKKYPYARFSDDFDQFIRDYKNEELINDEEPEQEYELAAKVPDAILFIKYA